MTTRVSPPGGGYGNPDRWPVAHRIDDTEGAPKLEKLLDGLHEHALVAWDRDVTLKDGNITVATSDHRGPDGDNILGYAYVDCTTIWRLMRVVDDPLGVRWIGFCSTTSTSRPHDEHDVPKQAQAATHKPSRPSVKSQKKRQRRGQKRKRR